VERIEKRAMFLQDIHHVLERRRDHESRDYFYGYRPHPHFNQL